MQVLFLLIVMVAQLLQWMCKKQYNLKITRQEPLVFNGVSALTAAVIFGAMADWPLQLPLSLLPYVLLFSVAFGSAAFFSLLAVQAGSMSLTSLAISYSLVIPTLYGLLFLGEPVSVTLIVGVLLLLGSLFLVNAKKEEATVNRRWLAFALLAFLGNGVCSTTQTVQQLHFDGRYKGEFMFASMLLLSAFFLTVSFLRHRQAALVSLRQGWSAMVTNGLCNGTVNLFVMLLVSGGMAASVMFPVLSGGGLILTTLLSVLVYRERLSLPQYIGLAMGTASVVLMNL